LWDFFVRFDPDFMKISGGLAVIKDGFSKPIVNWCFGGAFSFISDPQNMLQLCVIKVA